MNNINGTSIPDLLHKVTKYQTKLAGSSSQNESLYRAKIAYYLSHLSKAGVNVNQLGGGLAEGLAAKKQEILDLIAATKTGDITATGKLGDESLKELGTMTTAVYRASDISEQARKQNESVRNDLADLAKGAYGAMRAIKDKFPLEINVKDAEVNFDDATMKKLEAARFTLDDMVESEIAPVTNAFAYSLLRELLKSDLNAEKLNETRYDFETIATDQADRTALETVLDGVVANYATLGPYVDFLKKASTVPAGTDRASKTAAHDADIAEAEAVLKNPRPVEADTKVAMETYFRSRPIVSNANLAAKEEAAIAEVTARHST